nr:hypothetical protein [uncultured Carboxylicivirga sp.]
MAQNEVGRTIKWLDQEIKAEQTGTPDQLASKLCMSVRMLFFYLDMMRALGADITFCKERMTFNYAKSGHFIHGAKWVED